MDELDHQVLQVEGRRWRDESRKVSEIPHRLGLSHMEYMLRLVRLLDDPEALKGYPLLINRLCRVRDRRRALRAR